MASQNPAPRRVSMGGSMLALVFAFNLITAGSFPAWAGPYSFPALQSKAVHGNGPEEDLNESTGRKIKLKVKLYPWIPDTNGDGFASIAKRIESEFMRRNPDVALDVNPECFTEDVYNVPYVTSVLKGQQADCSVDVVEIDMLMLGDLVDAGAVRPWRKLPPANWHPASVEASRYQGKLYGIPHWMCSHFVFTRSPKVARANSSGQLITALKGLGTPAINLTGHFLLDWNTNALFLDAWVDRKGGDPSNGISATELDPDVLRSFSAVAQQCGSDGVNHCLDGSWEEFETFDTPIQLFANGEADATFGYLERLNAIANYLPAGTSLEDAGIYMNTIPFGKRNKPLIFTDSFVLSKRCTGSCADAAHRFAAYVSRTRTTEWIVASHDVPEASRIPRYLLIANRDTYTSRSVRNNPFFSRADSLTRDAKPFPNSGFYPVLGPMYDLILDGLEK